MNRIHPNKYLLAMELFLDGCSIRKVMKSVGISRETAHRVQKGVHIINFEFNGKTRVLTGKKGDGSFSFYHTKEWRDHWNIHANDGSYIDNEPYAGRVEETDEKH